MATIKHNYPALVIEMSDKVEQAETATISRKGPEYYGVKNSISLSLVLIDPLTSEYIEVKYNKIQAGNPIRNTLPTPFNKAAPLAKFNNQLAIAPERINQSRIIELSHVVFYDENDSDEVLDGLGTPLEGYTRKGTNITFGDINGNLSLTAQDRHFDLFKAYKLAAVRRKKLVLAEDEELERELAELDEIESSFKASFVKV